MTNQTKLLEKLETQSSIFEKTDPDFRRRRTHAAMGAAYSAVRLSICCISPPKMSQWNGRNRYQYSLPRKEWVS